MTGTPRRRGRPTAAAGVIHPSRAGPGWAGPASRARDLRPGRGAARRLAWPGARLSGPGRAGPGRVGEGDGGLGCRPAAEGGRGLQGCRAAGRCRAVPAGEPKCGCRREEMGAMPSWAHPHPSPGGSRELGEGKGGGACVLVSVGFRWSNEGQFSGQMRDSLVVK